MPAQPPWQGHEEGIGGLCVLGGSSQPDIRPSRMRSASSRTPGSLEILDVGRQLLGQPWGCSGDAPPSSCLFLQGGAVSVNPGWARAGRWKTGRQKTAGRMAGSWLGPASALTYLGFWSHCVSWAGPAPWGSTNRCSCGLELYRCPWRQPCHGCIHSNVGSLLDVRGMLGLE